MKHKTGDKVKIKSYQWYNDNKDSNGDVHGCNITFNSAMSMYCGKEMTIEEVHEEGQFYYLYEDIEAYIWTDDMFEGIADVEPQEKMVSLEKVEEWLYKNFYESYNLNNYGTYDLDKPYITSLFDTINEMFDDLRKTMEE